MINFRKVKRFCNEDLSLIENYDKAISDSNQTWDCHHRREITTPRKELIEIGEYYNRPASELIFLTRNEHMAIHASLFFKGKPSWNKGRRLTNEHKRQISKALKGHTLSEEARRKIAEGNKGKKMSEEAKLKIGEYGKMSHWFNNGTINIKAKSCPEGFVRGMYYTEDSRNKLSTSHKGIPCSPEAKQKLSNAFKGLYYFNNGIINVRAKSCPEGFVRGRLKNKTQRT